MKLFLLAALFPFGGAGLSVHGRGPVVNASAAASVEALHKKMEVIAAALEHMVDGGNSTPSSLSHAKVAPELRAFIKELKFTLKETAHPSDAANALERLRKAQASMKDLTAELSAQQMRLMHESEAEQESLLLGILMTRRNAPFEKQLEIVKSDSFKDLPVAKALVAAHDSTHPLFEQAGAYLDKQSPTGHAPQVAAAEEKAAKLKKTIGYFTTRIEKLQQEEARMTKSHNETVTTLSMMIKKGPAEKAKKLQFVMKHSDREFKKRILKVKQQAKLLQNVVTAMENGDLKALKTAQDALQQSLERMKQRTGDFLHLLQLGSRLSSDDCPYCAAQCIDKCHTAGNPYTQCLTQCADAGK